MCISKPVLRMLAIVFLLAAPSSVIESRCNAAAIGLPITPLVVD